jgi:RimJ/RimL family protein N-acetyltransferase
VIETDRLLLRALADDDLDDAHRELYSDPEVTWSGATFSREEAAEGIATKRRHLDEPGFAFTQLGLDRVVAVVRPGNEASKNVLAKVGFTFVADEHHYDQDAELWEARSTVGTD